MGRWGTVVAWMGLGVALISMDLPTIAVAQAPVVQPPIPSFGERLTGMLPMLVIVYFIFYFLLIRPRAAEERAQKKLFEGLKKGDPVVTSFGLYGRVGAIDDKTVTLEIAPSVKVRVERKTVVRREDSQSAA